MRRPYKEGSRDLRRDTLGFIGCGFIFWKIEAGLRVVVRSNQMHWHQRPGVLPAEEHVERLQHDGLESRRHL